MASSSSYTTNTFSLFIDDLEGKSTELFALLTGGKRKEAAEFLLKNRINTESFHKAMQELYHRFDIESVRIFFEEILRQDAIVSSKKGAWLVTSIIKYLADLNCIEEGHKNFSDSDKKWVGLITLILPYITESQICQLLRLGYPIDSTKLVLDYYYTLSVTQQAKLIPHLIEYALSNYNAFLLRALHVFEVKQGREIAFQALLNAHKPDQIEKALFFISLSNEKEAWLVMKLMNEFIYGFGDITYEGGLLTLAQIHSRKRGPHFEDPVKLKVLGSEEEFKPKISDKVDLTVLVKKEMSDEVESEAKVLAAKSTGKEEKKEEKRDPEQERKDPGYLFNPVLLKNVGFFDDYLLALKECPPPHRERFVIAGEHWVGGDIFIDESGRLSVLFMDSLGTDNIYETDTQDAILILAKIYPEATIYFLDLKRQRASGACQAFALQDVQRLFVIDNYLGEEYKSAGTPPLHAYLANSAKALEKTIKLKDSAVTCNVSLCQPPLALILTMQSSKFFSELSKRTPEEQKIIVNKKGMTAEEVAERHFKPFFDTKKKVNQRLDEIREKWVRYNFTFLKSKDSNSLSVATEPFTLIGFQKRMSALKAERLLNSVSSIKTLGK